MDIKTMAELIKKHPSPISELTRLAQAVHETGNFKSNIFKNANNSFGIKASAPWSGATFDADSGEHRPEGYKVERSAFRKYPNVEASVKDHAGFFTSTDYRKNVAYKKAIDADNYVDELRHLTGTYATDPKYMEKCLRTIENYNLKSYGVKESSFDTVIEDRNKTGDIEAMIKWMTDRLGKITYSMTIRLGPNSYDCSSAVYSALIAGGFLPEGTWLGNTETLFGLEGTLLVPINRNEVRRGDLFVAGRKGHSLGSGGHTGIATSSSDFIHTTHPQGMVTGKIDTYLQYTDLPTYWYRLSGVSSRDINLAEYTSPELPFKQHKVGDIVAIKDLVAWYLPESTSTGRAPSKDFNGDTDEIIRVMDVNISNSKKAYLLKDKVSWILEENLEESYEDWEKVDKGDEFMEGMFYLEGQKYRVRKLDIGGEK